MLGRKAYPVMTSHFFVHQPQNRSKLSAQIVLSGHVARAGVTHNVLAPRSFRSEVLHGRSGPCRLLRFSTVPSTSYRYTSRRPRCLGSYCLRHFWISTFWRTGIFLLGFYRSLVGARVVERACASVEHRERVFNLSVFLNSITLPNRGPLSTCYNKRP